VRFICLALLAAGFAPAQDGPPDPRTERQQVANQPEQSPYAGPSILGRDPSLRGERKGKLLDLRFYGEIAGVYDSAVTPIAASTPSQPANAIADYGTESGAGLTASRRWKHARLSLEYRGRFSDYARNSLFNGSNQFLNLDYSGYLNRYWILDLKETAGTTTLSNGAFTYLPLTSTDLFAVPSNDLFDNRTNYLESRIDLEWQKSLRLSFNFGGEGFLVRRESLALAGLNGYGARAGVAYRLTRRQTVSATYQHIYFDFQRTFGNARIETAALGYSVGLTRRMDFGLQAGGSRVATSGLTQVSLDPDIAAIVGRDIAIVTFARSLYVPFAEARLTRRFDRSSLILDFSSGVSPGNGVYLTSRQNSAAMTYLYTGFRRLSAALSAGYNQLSTIGQTLPKYTNLQAGGGLTYKLIGETYLAVRYDYRHYTTQNLLFQKDSNRVSLGLAFAPGDAPLAIW
jgi:hypothetical protein